MTEAPRIVPLLESLADRLSDPQMDALIDMDIYRTTTIDALRGQLRELQKESESRDLWWHMACSGLRRMIERRGLVLTAQERNFIARVKAGPDAPMRRWGAEEEETESMPEMGR